MARTFAELLESSSLGTADARSTIQEVSPKAAQSLREAIEFATMLSRSSLGSASALDIEEQAPRDAVDAILAKSLPRSEKGCEDRQNDVGSGAQGLGATHLDARVAVTKKPRLNRRTAVPLTLGLVTAAALSAATYSGISLIAPTSGWVAKAVACVLVAGVSYGIDSGLLLRKFTPRRQRPSRVHKPWMTRVILGAPFSLLLGVSLTGCVYPQQFNHEVDSLVTQRLSDFKDSSPLYADLARAKEFEREDEAQFARLKSAETVYATRLDNLTKAQNNVIIWQNVYLCQSGERTSCETVGSKAAATPQASAKTLITTLSHVEAARGQVQTTEQSVADAKKKLEEARHTHAISGLSIKQSPASGIQLEILRSENEIDQQRETASLRLAALTRLKLSPQIVSTAFGLSLGLTIVSLLPYWGALGTNSTKENGLTCDS